MVNLIEIAVEFSHQEDSLVLVRKLVNRTDKNVFVASRSTTVKNKSVDGLPSYIALSADSTFVRVLNGVSPLPDEYEVEFQVAPMCTELVAKQSLEERFEFRLPLKEWDAYHVPEADSNTKIVEVKELEYCVDFIQVDKASRAKPITDRVVAVVGEFSRVSIRIKSNTGIQVAVRDGEFPRS